MPSRKRNIRKILRKVAKGVKMGANIGRDLDIPMSGLAHKLASSTLRNTRRRKKQRPSHGANSTHGKVEKVLLPSTATSTARGAIGRVATGFAQDFETYSSLGSGNRAYYVDPNRLEDYLYGTSLTGGDSYPITGTSSSASMPGLASLDNCRVLVQSGYIQLTCDQNSMEVGGQVYVKYFIPDKYPGSLDASFPTEPSDICVINVKYPLAKVLSQGGLIIPYIHLRESPIYADVDYDTSSSPVLDNFYWIAVMFSGLTAADSVAVGEFNCVANYDLQPAANSVLAQFTSIPAPPNPALINAWRDCERWLLESNAVFPTGDIDTARRMCLAHSLSNYSNIILK